MKLTIEMELDNAAFVDGGCDEIVDVLTRMANKLPETTQEMYFGLNLVLTDSNGNRVGFARID